MSGGHLLLPQPEDAPCRGDKGLTYLTEIGWDCMDWIDLAQDKEQWRALVNTVMNLRVP
jgi:hypothetical protein